MNWNEITQGIDHVSGKQIKLTTDPNMKIDIDGEIALETPINVEVLPDAIKLLTFLIKIITNDNNALTRKNRSLTTHPYDHLWIRASSYFYYH